MARYIDAEGCFEDYVLHRALFGNDISFIDYVRQYPTEDVQPVVHAHWIEFENPNYSPFDNSPEKIVLCSHCSNGHGTKDDYCCVCGAKMDEEV